MTGRLLRVLRIEDKQTSVPRRRPKNHLAREAGVAGHDRADQASRTSRRQLDDLPGRRVGHQGGHRSERLDLVRFCPFRVVGSQQDRRDERAPLSVGVDQVDPLRVTEDDGSGVPQRLQRTTDLLALLEAGQRPHPDIRTGRVADGDARQPFGSGLRDVVDPLGRDERPPYRRALLPGLDRHLGDELFDEEVELGRSRRGIRAEDREVERVGLGVEPDRVANDHGVCAQPLCRGGRAGE